MLQVTVELVPHGVGPPRTVGRAVVGQLGRSEPSRHRYAAAIGDDLMRTTPVVVTVDHDRADGLWELFRRVLDAVADGRPPNDLPQNIRDRLDRALHDVTDTTQTVAHGHAEVYSSALTMAAAATQIGVPTEHVDDLLETGELVALDGPDGPRLPAWQLHDGLAVGYLDGIGRVAPAYPGSVLALSLWAVVPNQSLGARTPAQALADGDVDQVVFIAAAGL